MMSKMYRNDKCKSDNCQGNDSGKERYNPVHYGPEHYGTEQNCGCGGQGYVPKEMVMNVPRMANTNKFYRKEIWTGYNSQMTVMSIPVKGEVGTEVHKENDQIIRIEGGFGLVVFGKGEETIRVTMGDTVFVPAGICHNIVNVGRMPLKLSSTYSPSHHPVGTVEQ